MAQGQPAPPPASQVPVLFERPAVSDDVAERRRIQLDVLVTDKAGKPQSGLELKDFRLLDNGQPAKILSFHASDEPSAEPGPPVRVILLFDMVNTPFSQASFARQQMQKFLRRNGGHLEHPVEIYVLTDQGVMAQPTPPNDGNALAADLDRVDASLRSVGRSAQGAQGAVERFQLSLRLIEAVAGNEAKKPGRKLLIWPGPGWPILDWGAVSPSREHTEVFNSIVQLSTALREARIDLCSMVQAGPNGFSSYRFQDFLKGVKTVDKANLGNLDLKVLAVQSGGRALDASNDLTKQIEACLQDAGPYYTMSFDAPRSDHADEYHDLKVVIDKPGLTARTSSGYYNQP
jgi:VWFA-related protein